MNSSQIRVTLNNIYDIYENLIQFVRNAEKHIISGKGSVDFSQISAAKDELKKLVFSLKSFSDHSILKESGLSGELSRLRGKIDLYNRLKDDFIQLSIDSMQFYNDLIDIDRALYNQNGKIMSNLPNMVLVRA